MSTSGKRPGRPSKVAAAARQVGSGAGVDGDRISFAVMMHDHLRKLDWSQDELADRTGISKSQINAWLNQSDRRIGQGDVCRIAWAISGGMDGVFRGLKKFRELDIVTSKGAVDGRTYLDQLLNNYLVAAGFSPTPGSNDLIWREKFESNDDVTASESRKEKRPLRVGWVYWPTFAENDETGYASAIATQVCRYLGAGKPEFIPLDPGDVRQKVRTREVDLIAPVLIQFPRRLADLRFSNPIPDILVGIKAVTIRETQGKLLSEYQPNVVRGEVGETMADFLIPTDPTAIDHQLRPRGFAKLEEAMSDLRTKTIDPITEKPRCLIVDEITYQGIATKKIEGGGDFVDVELSNGPDVWRNDQFPIGFAVHPDEPNLLNAINLCIDILDRNGFFKHLFGKMKTDDPRLYEAIYKPVEPLKEADESTTTSQTRSRSISSKSRIHRGDTISKEV